MCSGSLREREKTGMADDELRKTVREAEEQLEKAEKQLENVEEEIDQAREHADEGPRADDRSD
jgi:chromosome segregation ATPase